MSDLIGGWERTTLGQLGRYLNGRAFKKSEWRESGRPIIRIQNLTGSGEAHNFFQGPVEERYVVRPGDLLVSWAATLGAYIWTGPEAVLNQHIFKVESNIDPRFHKYLLDHKLSELMRHTHGSGMVHITRPQFNAVPVDIPSQEEQRLVVDILEDHLSRLDAADRALSAARGKSSTIAGAAASQELADVCGRPRAIGDLALSVKNGIFVSRAGRVADGVPILRIGAVRALSLNLDDMRYSGRQITELAGEDALLEAGDVLFTRYNGNPEYVGSCAEVPQEALPLTYPDKLIRVRTDREQILPSYLAIACSFGVGRRQIASNVKTTAGQAGISGRDLKSVKLAVPDLASQAEVVRRVDLHIAATRRLGGQVDDLAARNSLLRRAVLSAAFSGRLTGRRTDHEVIEEIADV